MALRKHPDEYLFVSGSPRSGTTLLRLVLSAHPCIAISPENHSLERIICHFSHRRVLQGAALQSLKRLIVEDTKLEGWKLDLSPYREKVLGYTAITARQAAEDLICYYRDQTTPDAYMVGNKKGFFLEYTETVHHMFPEAKFIFIVRDPRDAVLSMKTHLPDYDLWSASLAWRRRAAHSHMVQEKYPGKCMEIKYEDLVSASEESCRKICSFLKVSYSNRMLEFYRKNNSLEGILQGKETMHQQTRGPMTKKRIGGWSGGMSEEEIHLVETLTRGEMGRRGYMPSLTAGLNLTTRTRCMYARMRDHFYWRRKRLHIRSLTVSS